MVNFLIGIHAAFGELGIFAFLWCLVEIININEQRIKRAKIAALIGTFFIILSWIFGGFYYTNYYGNEVKPIIKEGPIPWAHNVIMEAKEHIFLFLPFLSILSTAILFKKSKNLDKYKKGLIILIAIIILIGFTMAGMGYLISTGARAGLEAKI
ncbi:hypothetical protein J4440_00900 [Candidatus Woesearchaeota archaeon]|nr:hypothetical protein [Candidatus Woesearchaeota archaeon]